MNTNNSVFGNDAHGMSAEYWAEQYNIAKWAIDESDRLHRAELASLHATVAALTASRADLMAQLAACGNAEPPNGDSAAAYRRGWCDAIEAAAVLVENEQLPMIDLSNTTRMEIDDVIATREYAMADSIRAMQPPTAPTEHDAAKLRSLIDYTKSKPQSQASLRDQLNALIELANINGLYDAADFVAGRNK